MTGMLKDETGKAYSETAQSERPQLSIKNQFMFNKVMIDELICKAFLERVLGCRIDSISYLNAEQTLDSKVDARGVRLDLFARTGDKVFDIELQVDARFNLPKRYRYYQAAIDTAALGRGTDFGELPESYLIFLCDYDPMGADLARYTFERICLENPSIRMEAEAHWLAFNCPAYEKEADPRMRALLEYISTGKIDADDALVCAMADAVNAANADRKWVDEVLWSVSTIQEDLEREVRMARKAVAKAEREAEQKAKEAEMLGKTRGEAQGEERFASLVDRLLDAGRIDDLKQAADDAAFREQLFQEFGIA